MKRTSWLAAACSLVLAASVGGLASAADSLTDGMKAANAGDYATAQKAWRPLAEAGNAKAQSYLGTMYLQGFGVTQSFEKAAYWYGKAAPQGDSAAQNNLGLLYRDGAGVERDPVQAAHWFRMAAEQGALEAMVNLGDAYAAGSGVPKDKTEAVRWYRRAADSDFPRAKAALQALESQAGGGR